MPIELKGLPHNDEAERVLLGAMLLDSSNIAPVLNGVELKDFYRRAHLAIFKAVVTLFEADAEIDPVLVSEELIKENALEEAGGYEYIDDLTRGIPRTTNIEYYANIVREKSLLRQLAHLGDLIAKSAITANVDAMEAISSAENELLSLREGRVSHGFSDLKGVLDETYQVIQERAADQSGFVGIRTGFLDFDRMTNGLQKGDLVIVAARPAMGKTSFCLNIALNASLLDKAKVAIFSLEMPASQLVTRLLGSEARVSISDLRAGRLGDDDWNSLGMAVAKMAESEIFIDDSGEATVAQMRAQLKRLKMESGIDLVVIDYLQLMTGSSLQAQQSRVQEVSAISRGLKIMAKELECPVIALSQLSRAAEQRSDHRPQLSDLRESGSIEQDADMVCFLYREDYYKEKSQDVEDVEGDHPDFGISELIIAKHRNGPTGKVNLAFFKQFTRFENYSDELEIL